jgi:hypothetical protein
MRLFTIEGPVMLSMTCSAQTLAIDKGVVTLVMVLVVRDDLLERAASLTLVPDSESNQPRPDPRLSDVHLIIDMKDLDHDCQVK